jgi:hypothetical protein
MSRSLDQIIAAEKPEIADAAQRKANATLAGLLIESIKEKLAEPGTTIVELTRLTEEHGGMLRLTIEWPDGTADSLE